MNVRYSKTLLGWIVEGNINGRHIVVVSLDMARGMALYRSLEDCPEPPDQSVYLARSANKT